MINGHEKIGNFSSSEIAALMAEGKKAGTLGVPALTYIQECNMERRLGRPLERETDTRPTSWGHLCEGVAFDLLPTAYRLCSKETLTHPDIPYWKGTPDSIKLESDGLIVCDIKAPYTLKSFCQFIDLWKLGGINAIRNGFKDDQGNQYKAHPDGEKFYWQLVSNAILTEAIGAELIVFCPYLSELTHIRNLVEGNPSYYWIWGASDQQLPYLPDHGYYQHLNIMHFDIPDKDKADLHDCVIKAGDKLVKPYLLTV